ncbi:hypothetical protein [Flavobacterium soyae]|uniref:Uncharacterized protein n=1 Tax=Flavobacterium soyae TaxID=2903098 RepID=A0ABZ2UEJ4_9FLAO
MSINFKEKVKGLFKYIFLGILLLGILIFRVGLDGNIMFVGIGIIILLPFGIWLFIENSKDKKAIENNNAEIQKLKKYGEKIIVNLENIPIKSNSWKEEVRHTSQYEDKVSSVNINYNLIELEIPYKGDFIHYSLHIGMDTTILKMHFAIKRETVLYIDLKDKNKNYLDLEFLER